jgi:hypothetical protein
LLGCEQPLEPLEPLLQPPPTLPPALSDSRLWLPGRSSGQPVDQGMLSRVGAANTSDADPNPVGFEIFWPDLESWMIFISFQCLTPVLTEIINFPLCKQDSV